MDKHGTRVGRLTAMVSLAMWALQVAAPAQAGLILSNGPYAFAGSASVTDTKATPGASTHPGATMGDSISIAPFDPALGVLTGVSHQIASTRKLELQGGGAGGASVGSATGTASATASLVAPGLSAGFGSVTAPTASCSSAAACTYGYTSADTAANGTYAVGISHLNDYVGSAPVSATRTAPTLSATSNGSKAATTATATQSWIGTLTTSYSYLLHAAPSFDGLVSSPVLTLDFGDVLLGADTSPLLFRIANLASLQRVALDLDGVEGSGDTSVLSTDISAFMNLSAGQSSEDFSAFMDTSTLGHFGARYVFTFSDEDIGASDSRYKDMTLTLNLSGHVIEAPLQASLSVPEPGGLVLLSAGILGLGWSRRSKSSKK
jgi:hypothetical protein